MSEKWEQKPWIGVGLDGTLAEYDFWRGHEHIGSPIALMLKRVKHWIGGGKVVKIFTARAMDSEGLPAIRAWLKQHGLPELEITNSKDYAMVELWDDRCVQVEHNTGERMDGQGESMFVISSGEEFERAKVEANGDLNTFAKLLVERGLVGKGRKRSLYWP